MIAPSDPPLFHWNGIDAALKSSESVFNREDTAAETQGGNAPQIDLSISLDNDAPPLRASSGHSSVSQVGSAAGPAEEAFPNALPLGAANLFFAHSLSSENIEPAEEGGAPWDALSKHNHCVRHEQRSTLPDYDRLASRDGESEEEAAAPSPEKHSSHVAQNAGSQQFAASSPLSSFAGAGKPRYVEEAGFFEPRFAAASSADSKDGTRLAHRPPLPNPYAEQTAAANHNSTPSLSLPREGPAKLTVLHMSADDVVASSALRDWEQRHEDALEEAQQEEIRYRKRLQEEAQRQLEEWYEENARRREARHQANIAEEARQKDAQALSPSGSKGKGEPFPESEMSWTCVRNLLLQTSTSSGLPLVAATQNGSRSCGVTGSKSDTRRGSPSGLLGTPLLTSSTAASTSSSSSAFDKRKAGGEDGGAASSWWGAGDRDTMRMRHILDTLAERERVARE